LPLLHSRAGDQCRISRRDCVKRRSRPAQILAGAIGRMREGASHAPGRLWGPGQRTSGRATWSPAGRRLGTPPPPACGTSWTRPVAGANPVQPRSSFL